jgi:hypothetical protein
MGFADTMRVWSNINCGLASMNTYFQQRSNGVNTQYATMNLFGNLANGITRNELAYGMQLHGNPSGNMINMFAGYGNPVSNTVGTLGILSCTPSMFFNAMPYCMPMYGSVGMGGFGSPMMYPNMGFYC